MNQRESVGHNVDFTVLFSWSGRRGDARSALDANIRVFFIPFDCALYIFPFSFIFQVYTDNNHQDYSNNWEKEEEENKIQNKNHFSRCLSR